jgi:hypothetical protein
MALRKAGKGYVLGVSAKHGFNAWGKSFAVPGTAKTIVENLPEDAWKRLAFAMMAVIRHHANNVTPPKTIYRIGRHS